MLEATTDPSSIALDLRQTIKQFSELAKNEQVFAAIQYSKNKTCLESAYVIAKAWYGFSEFMPLYLCEAGARMRDNLRRHYVIRIAYEELGERNVQEIHSALFLESCEKIGLDRGVVQIGSRGFCTSATLEALLNLLKSSESDSFILGLNMGLEIIANENIETLFWMLLHERELSKVLKDSVFFKIHLVNEDDHIKLTVSNFSRFCKSDSERQEYVRGFVAGIQFWKEFWSKVDLEIKRVKAS